MNDAPISDATVRDSIRRKAAVLLAQLDTAAADAVLDRLPSPQAEELRAQVVSLEQIDAAEKRAVMGEFLAAKPFESWRTERQLAARHTPEADAADLAAPFSSLHETPPEELARSLGDESAPAAALVIRHLPPAQAAAVLARLDRRLQAEAISSLVQASPADALPLNELEHRLRSRLVEADAAQAGQDSLVEILKAASPFDQEMLRESLAQHAPDLAARLAGDAHAKHVDTQPAFDDVLRLADERLARLFYEADPDVAILALAGGPASLVERVCDQLPAREARLMQRAVENLGPVRLGDIDAARQEMARLLRRFDQSSPLGETQARRLAVMV